MIIVAFGRGKEVGKDTAAKFMNTWLRSNFSGIHVKIAGFADKVKAVAFDLYGWAGLKDGAFYDNPEGRHLKDVVIPKLGKSPRQIYIDLGNGIRNRVLDETWAEYLMNTTRADVLIIKDMRFPTEAGYVTRAGGFPVEIIKPDAPQHRDGADECLEGYSGWYDRIKNDGDINSFYNKIIELSERIFKNMTVGSRSK